MLCVIFICMNEDVRFKRSDRIQWVLDTGTVREY